MNKISTAFIALFFVSISVNAQADDPLLKILEKEMNREMEYFSKEDHPPYFLSFSVDDYYTASIASEMGSLIHSTDMRIRYFKNDMRVGDYKFDNTHKIENQFYGGRPMQMFSFIPTENDELAISQLIWEKSEAAYKQTSEAYRTRIEMSDLEKQEFPDFSKEPTQIYYDPINEDMFVLNRSEWEEKIKSYSEPFVEDTNIFNAQSQLGYLARRSYYISTEGSKIVQNSSYITLGISAQIKCSDESIVPYSKVYYARAIDKLPNDAAIKKDIDSFIATLKNLANAPIAEAFSGPAILSPEAAAVFFHEIFGHRVEGHRLKDKSDGHTFKDKIDTKVLPKEINLTFDPTIDKFKAFDLMGSFKYDDEGVKSQTVKVIENGILKDYLMSRTPNDLYQKSNGHGRSQGVLPAVARQSNMIIETEKPKSMDYLRKQLIKECKKQGKEYGYYFKEVIGGFTTTSRYRPDVFNIKPIEVYRIFVDGRPDELVRGVSLIGTPLVMFSEIKASGDTYGIFNGLCGAESGSVPVSAVAPAMLIGKIETQKEPVVNIDMPILEDPYIDEKQNKETIKTINE